MRAGRWIGTLAGYPFSHAKHPFSNVGNVAHQRRLAMPKFNPFDMDLDGDVDGIDFLGFDQMVQHIEGGRDNLRRGSRGTVSDPCANVVGLGALLFALVGCLATLGDALDPSGRLCLLIGGALAASVAGVVFLSRKSKAHSPGGSGELPREVPKAEDVLFRRQFGAPHEGTYQPAPAGTSLADSYEERVQQWKDRADRTYGAADRRRSAGTEYNWELSGHSLDRMRQYHPPEPPPDEWSRDELNYLVGGSVDRDDRVEYQMKVRRYSDEPPDNFYKEWAAECDGFDPGHAGGSSSSDVCNTKNEQQTWRGSLR